MGVAQQRPPGALEVERAGAGALIALGWRGGDQRRHHPGRDRRVDVRRPEQMDERLRRPRMREAMQRQPREDVGAELGHGRQEHQRLGSRLAEQRFPDGQLRWAPPQLDLAAVVDELAAGFALVVQRKHPGPRAVTPAREQVGDVRAQHLELPLTAPWPSR